jgi:hypothetical protein
MVTTTVLICISELGRGMQTLAQQLWTDIRGVWILNFLEFTLILFVLCVCMCKFGYSLARTTGSIHPHFVTYLRSISIKHLKKLEKFTVIFRNIKFLLREWEAVKNMSGNECTCFRNALFAIFIMSSGFEAVHCKYKSIDTMIIAQ